MDKMGRLGRQEFHVEWIKKWEIRVTNATCLEINVESFDPFVTIWRLIMFLVIWVLKANPTTHPHRFEQHRRRL